MKISYSKKNKPKKGEVVVLEGNQHVRAAFTRYDGNVDLAIPDTIDTAELRKLGQSGKHLSLCFSPRLIYADTGDFTNVSPEATYAHIHATVDKLRLFHEDYSISYTTIADIDATKSTYSYLAVAKSETYLDELLDEDNTFVDVFCPVEAALTAALALVDKEMAVVVLEDAYHIRIVGAKNGIVYYLITVNIRDSFDPEADTVAGINEMKSLLMNSYRERVGNIYLAGIESLNEQGFSKLGVDVLPFPMSYGDDLAMTNPVLIGTAMQSRYDFTSERLRFTKKIMHHSRISLGVSALMLLIAGVFLFLGIAGWFGNRELDERIAQAQRRKAAELAQIEKDYDIVSKSLDISNVNVLVQNYREFQAEPQLPVIVETVSHKIPPSVVITKIEIKRPEKGENAPPMREGSMPDQDGSEHAQQISHFKVNVEGIINVPFPRSRSVFSELLSNFKDDYSVDSAKYSHKQDKAFFVLECQVKI